MAANPERQRVELPRIRAEVNGVILDTVIQANVVLAGSSRTSRFELIFSLDGHIPGERWLSQLVGRVRVSIQPYFDNRTGAAAVFEGLADHLDLDPVRRMGFIRGRDYSSVLLNSVVQDSFCNLTASEIASLIADRHGFEANIVPTTSLIGSYRGNGHTQLMLNANSRFVNEWDLLRNLAKLEDFVLLMNGTTMTFAPIDSLRRSYSQLAKSDVKVIRFSRAFPLSDQSRVIVKSWNSWLGETIEYADPMPLYDGLDGSIGTTLTSGDDIVVVKPNLTPEDAEQLGRLYQETISERQVRVEITMPAGMSVDPLDVLTIRGSDSEFDRDYLVRSVRWRYSSTGGYVIYIEGHASRFGGISSTIPAG